MKINENAKYVVGLDCARAGQDSSVIIVIELGDNTEKKPHRVVFIKEIKKNTMDALYDYMLWLHGQFDFEAIYVDSTGLGAGLADFLIREINSMKKQKFERPGYNFKYRRSDVVRAVTFTIKSKMDMFSHLKLLMEQGLLKIPPNDALKWQLTSLEFELTEGGQMKLHHPDVQGAKDDYVDALVLAAQGTRQERGAVVWLD